MADTGIIRSLARGGATQQAWDAFVAAGHADRVDDPALLTLHGRLLKDRAALADGAERQALLRAAAEAYGAAARIDDATYPRINAATLVFLRGDRAAAATLARDVLAMIDSGEHAPETPYWIGATRAEALLLLGRPGDAQRALADAVANAPAAREDRAATLRQFRRILAASGSDDSWLDPFRVPPVMHFRGPMAVVDPADEAAIRAAVAAISPAFAVGALAAGTDIVAAEAALAAGAELHVLLPADPARFRRDSVCQCGADWAERFDRLLAAASGVEILDEPGGLTSAAVWLADDMAMGLAVAQAQSLDGRPAMLRARWAGTGQKPDLPVPHDPWLVDLHGDAPGVAAVDLPGPLEPALWIAPPGGGAATRFSLRAAAAQLPSLPPGTLVDVAVSLPGSGEPCRLTALRQLVRPHAVIGSRSAALVMAARVPRLCAVLAGEVASAAGPVEVHDLFLLPPQPCD